MRRNNAEREWSRLRGNLDELAQATMSVGSGDPDVSGQDYRISG
jgi:hypothetical protein